MSAESTWADGGFPAPEVGGDLADMVREFEAAPHGHHAIVVVPSLSFDTDLLSKVAGVAHYEERLLAMLLQLRRPAVHVVFCSSMPIPEQVVEYYLGLIPDVPLAHSRPRLSMVSVGDPSPRPLTRKLLDHPEALAAIRGAVVGARAVGLVTNNTTDLERALAQQLGIPLLGNPPGSDDLGTKSGSRETFREAGVDLPDGLERLRDFSDAVAALAELKARRPDLARAVVKLEEGFSGEGNAVFDYRDAGPGEVASVLARQLRTQGDSETLESYRARFDAMGGIVEEYLPGVSASPSGQAYIDPLGRLRPISTHDQVLGGTDGQVFLGSTFPASGRYRQRVCQDTLAVGEVLRRHGARGRFAVDFVESGQRLAAIEVNLRKGGTTHTMLALAMVTDGRLEPDGVTFVSATGAPKCYYATDNLASPAYRGLRASEVIAATRAAGLHFERDAGRGAVFHLMGALSDSGKIGVTCIDDDLDSATAQYRALVDLLDDLARRRDRG